MFEHRRAVFVNGAIFAAATLAASYAAVLATGAGGIFWSDFIHFNPHRSQAHALFIIVVTLPLAATIFVGLVLSVPALAAGVCAALAEGVFRRVPAWLLPAFAAVCTIVLNLQIHLAQSLFDVSGEYGIAAQNTAPLSRVLAGQALCIALYLVPLAWAWNKTKAKKVKVLNPIS
jgi:hypothetical protein